MKKTISIVAITCLAFTSTAIAKPVGNTKEKMEIAGVFRVQDNNSTIDVAYAKTSRPCPPF